jgi:PAS domain S-box-containing protein
MSLSASNYQEGFFGQQQQDLTEVLDRISDGFLAVDPKWRICYINRILAKRLGINREKFLKKNLWSSSPLMENLVLEKHFRKAMAERVTLRFEQYSDHFRQWFEITIHPSGTGLSVFFRNITERKVAEEELRKLSMVAKETENAVVMLDVESKITWINAAFTRMTGYSFEEAVGRLPSALLFGDQIASEELHYINDQQKKKLPVQVEILNYKKNGEPFWSEVSIQPLFDQNGNLEQFFSIRKDITERKRMEAELAEVQKKISAAVINAQERERAEVSRELHDNVNQVLTTVKLYTELCATGTVDLSVILPKCTALLNNTINEIRRISKQIAPPTLKDVGLREALTDLIQSINETNKLKLHLAISPLSCTTIDEKLQIATYRIAQEHLTNILKHAKASQVSVTMECANQFLSLAIIDDGVGFDTRKKVSGMGINNMKNRASLYNGRLSLESEEGKGCKLSVVFPVVCSEGRCTPRVQV